MLTKTHDCRVPLSSPPRVLSCLFRSACIQQRASPITNRFHLEYHLELECLSPLFRTLPHLIITIDHYYCLHTYIHTNTQYPAFAKSGILPFTYTVGFDLLNYTKATQKKITDIHTFRQLFVGPRSLLSSFNHFHSIQIPSVLLLHLLFIQSKLRSAHMHNPSLFYAYSSFSLFSNTLRPFLLFILSSLHLFLSFFFSLPFHPFFISTRLYITSFVVPIQHQHLSLI